MCMIMIMLMSVDFIWYIGHLVPSYQVRKTLPCCMKDLWGQKNSWGTLTSNIFSTLCNNIILCFIVINNFDTTLPIFCHWRHSGRNIREVLIFFKHTLGALKFDISQSSSTGRTCFIDIIHHQVAYKFVFVSNVLWIVWDHMQIYLDC